MSLGGVNSLVKMCLRTDQQGVTASGKLLVMPVTRFNEGGDAGRNGAGERGGRDGKSPGRK